MRFFSRVKFSRNCNRRKVLKMEINNSNSRYLNRNLGKNLFYNQNKLKKHILLANVMMKSTYRQRYNI